MFRKILSKKVSKVSAIVLLCLIMFAAGFATDVSLSRGTIGARLTSLRLGKDAPQGSDFSLLWNAWNQVHQSYVSKIDDQQLVYGSAKGMVAGLGDPYTVFFDPAEAKQFTEDVTGQFFGIGVEVGVQNQALTVIAPLDGTPAAKAGLRTGDIIAKINDKDTGTMTVNEAVSMIRGEKGTPVELTVVKKEGGEILDLSVVRDLIQVKSVTSSIKDGNIGYVRLSQFSDDTVASLTSLLNEYKTKSVSGIILDLRNNPGGYLQGAQGVASMFITSGVVVSSQQKDGLKQDLYTVGKPIFSDTPLIVLVNGGSASASEIVAGAIQDRTRGKLVGEKTFGKGSVQSVFNLPGGSSLKVTIAHWLTPNGRMIDKQGISPDTEVKMTADDVKSGKDPQLDKAMELLKK